MFIFKTFFHETKIFFETSHFYINVMLKSSKFYNNKWEGWHFKVDFNASNRIMI